MTGSTVKQLVCSVVNCAQLSSRRSTVIKNIWAVVHQHASNLLQDATNRGRNPQQVTIYDPVIMFASPAGNGGEAVRDFRSLIKAWIGLVKLLMKE